jgi:hypothetical protein
MNPDPKKKRSTPTTRSSSTTKDSITTRITINTRTQTSKHLHRDPSLHIRRRQRLHHTRTIHEPRPEDPVRIRKHAVLQTHDDELAAAEARADQAADVLRVRQVEGRVDLVEDVHGCWRVLEEGEDEGEGDEGSDVRG